LESLPVKFILDTHAWFWAVEMPEKIPVRARSILSSAANVPFGLSAISLWEMAKQVERKNIVLTIPIEEWMERALQPAFIEILPLTSRVAIDSTRLPGAFHRDPADQIIVATARSQNAIIITADQKIQEYGHVKTLWKTG
jgi:PIN domain nuclease of toxin-antitoxin system